LTLPQYLFRVALAQFCDGRAGSADALLARIEGPAVSLLH